VALRTASVRVAAGGEAGLDVTATADTLSTPYGGFARPVDPRVLRWRTLDPTVATVATGVGYTNTGPWVGAVVVGRAGGTTRVVAEADGVADTAEVLVLAGAPAGAALAAVALSRGGNGDHTCALDAAGAAYCWGDNRAGQLGDGTTSAHPGAVRVAGDARFTALATGPAHSCGLAADSTAYCWGDSAAVGRAGATAASSRTPRPVAGGRRFAALATSGVAGSTSVRSCALDAAGAVECWGGGVEPAPPPATAGRRFASLTVGFGYACGLTADGSGSCFNISGAGTAGPFAAGRQFTALVTSALWEGTTATCGTAGSATYCWSTRVGSPPAA
jgi:hypothetical protein